MVGIRSGFLLGPSAYFQVLKPVSFRVPGIPQIFRGSVAPIRFQGSPRVDCQISKTVRSLFIFGARGEGCEWKPFFVCTWSLFELSLVQNSYATWVSHWIMIPQRSRLIPLVICFDGSCTSWFGDFTMTSWLGNMNGTHWWSRWWFQIFFIFTPTWGRFPFWLIFFNWVVQPPTSDQFLHQF